MIVNVLGFPATQIPAGLNAKGLPIGFQVSVAPFVGSVSGAALRCAVGRIAHLLTIASLFAPPRLGDRRSQTGSTVSGRRRRAGKRVRRMDRA